MSRRWFALWGVVILAILLSGCEIATPPPPVETRPPTVSPKPTVSPAPPAPTAIPWPAERFVFTYLDKVWLADGDAPYAVTPGRAPALSPDGQRIAYLLTVSPTAGLSQVYVLDLAGQQIALVSGDAAPYGRPVWSPDGRSVAYTNGPILVVTDPRGEVQRVLATNVGAAGEGQVVPVWSADGEAIVCPLTSLAQPELFFVDLADGQAVRISYTDGYPVTAPLVVLSRDTSLGKRNTVFYVNPTDGGTLWAASTTSDRQRIAPALDHIVRMRLSADGGRLAGLRQAPGEKGYTLWVLDLSDGQLYTGAVLDNLPDQLRWSVDNRTIYWISRTALYRYTVASGQVQEIAELPSPTPLPTATPLPVEQRLLYFLDGAFYSAKAYAAGEVLKQVPTSIAVAAGYSLQGGVVAFARGADIYLLELVGGIPTRIYSFQQEGLLGIELVWSLQGNALLYSATYEQQGAAFDRRVDLGVIRLKPTSRELQEVQRFASLTDRSGATPLLYDGQKGEAIVVPWSGDLTFSNLSVYDVAGGVVVRSLAVAGNGAVSISDDQSWAAATDYDEATGRGYIYLYDLAPAEPVSRTFALPEGTFTRGPLRWSPDERYVAFIPLLGKPGEGNLKAYGIWALQVETLAGVQVVPLEDPLAFLVGWSTQP